MLDIKAKKTGGSIFKVKTDTYEIKISTPGCLSFDEQVIVNRSIVQLHQALTVKK